MKLDEAVRTKNSGIKIPEFQAEADRVILELAETAVKLEGVLPREIPYLNERYTDGTIDNIRINEDRKIRNETIRECLFVMAEEIEGLEEIIAPFLKRMFDKGMEIMHKNINDKGGFKERCLTINLTGVRDDLIKAIRSHILGKGEK